MDCFQFLFVLLNLNSLVKSFFDVKIFNHVPVFFLGLNFTHSALAFSGSDFTFSSSSNRSIGGKSSSSASKYKSGATFSLYSSFLSFSFELLKVYHIDLYIYSERYHINKKLWQTQLFFF